MNQSTVSMGDIVFPISFVNGSTLPLLYSSSISLVISPLTFVDVLLFELYRPFVLGLLVLKFLDFIEKFTQLLSSFFGDFVLVVRHLLKFDTSIIELMIGLVFLQLRSHRLHFTPFFCFFLLWLGVFNVVLLVFLLLDCLVLQLNLICVGLVFGITG